MEIELHANIELPKDFDVVKRVGAQGVGLYRTEFLYMNRKDFPDEEEHFETYSEVLRALGGIPVTIRTLDLGADKQVDGGRQDGPVAAKVFEALKGVTLSGPDALAAFQGEAVYHDDALDYSTNEPTLDGTASAVLLFTLIG